MTLRQTSPDRDVPNATTTNTTADPDIEAMDNVWLADYVHRSRGMAAVALEQADRASQVLLRRMEALGSRAVDHPSLDVTLEPQSPDYDQGRLQALYELAPKEEVSAAYEGAHVKSVTVPGRWNGTKLRALATKWGGPVAALIEQSRIPKPARLRIAPKEKSG